MANIALTIAGSDSGGGAGIQADLKTFSALGVYGASVITAITAQNTQQVRAAEVLSPWLIQSQIETVFADLPPQALKTGMLADSTTIKTVSETLQVVGAKNLIVDTVMVAKSGDKLLQDDAVKTLKTILIPQATLITPNIPEAEVLLGQKITCQEDIAAAAKALLALGCHAVLLKGGHLAGETSSDFFLSKDSAQWLTSPRQNTKNTHGTGCTLSAAITAGLAKGLPLLTAVEEAKNYISAAIAAADSLKVGTGHGPVHHFHAWW